MIKLFQQLLDVFKTEKEVWCVLFKTFGPLGWFCRLTGQFPVSGHLSKQHLHLKFVRFSLASLYSLLYNSGIAVLFTCYRINILRKSGCSSLTIILRNWQGLFFFLPLTNWADTLGLLQELEAFDREFQQLPFIVTTEATRSTTVLWFLPLLLLITFPVAMHLKYNSPATKVFILNALFGLMFAVFLVLFLWFSNEIVQRIRRLQTSCVKYIKVITDYNYVRPSLQIDKYSKLNAKLIDCVSLLNNGFSFKLAVACANYFSTTLVTAYFTNHEVTFAITKTNEKIWFTLFLILIGVTAAKMESANHLALDRIFDSPVSPLNPSWRTQFDVLVLRLDRSKVQFECPGLIEYSKQFVGSFTLVLVSYSIVMAQLAASG